MHEQVVVYAIGVVVEGGSQVVPEIMMIIAQWRKAQMPPSTDWDKKVGSKKMRRLLGSSAIA